MTSRLTRRVTSTAALVSMALLSAQTPAQPQRPVFRSDAHFVLVDAYPVRDGRIAEGLTRADFQVLEDGVPQTVELFEYVDGGAPEPETSRRDPASITESRDAVADPRARAFVVFLDIPHVSAAGAHRARVPLVDLLNRVLTPADLFGVISSDHEVSSLTFARRVTAVDGMLARYWAWGLRESSLLRPDESGLFSCFAYHDPPRSGERTVQDGARVRRLETVLIERLREDVVLDRLEDLVWALGAMREGRTNVLLFSEGWRLFTRDSGLQAEVERTPREPVGLGTRGGRPEMFTTVTQGQRDACILEGVRLAQRDGPARLRELVRLANAMNVSFFTVNPLGLVATDQNPAERLIAADPSLSIGADDGQRLTARREALMTLAGATDGLAVVHSNDLRLALQPVIEQLRSFYLLGYYSTNTTFDGQTRAITVRTADPRVTMRARRSYRAPSAADRVATAAAAAPETRELSLLARALDVLAGLRGPDDRTSNLARYLTADAAPLLGVPQWFRTMPSPRAPVVAAPAPAFRRTERLRVEWPVAGPPLMSRQVRVVNRSGQPMAVQTVVSERQDGEATRLVVDVLLAPLAPGDYVLDVSVDAAGTSRRSLVAFRVVP